MSELEKIKRIEIDKGYQIVLINRLIQCTIDKMYTNAFKNENKTVSEIYIKRVVVNYYPGFFQYVIIPLKFLV